MNYQRCTMIRAVTLYALFAIVSTATLSAQYERTILIEDFSSVRGINFGRGGPPAEWTFPVSVKKAQSTDLLTRSSTKHNAINVFVGVAFKLGGKKND